MSTKRLNIDILARDKTGQAFKSVQQETKKTTQTLATLKTVLFAVVGSQAIRQVLEFGNTFQNLQNRLKLVTNSTSELIAVQEELFKISQRTRGGFAETVELYQKLALQSQSLGLQSSELSQITENVNKVIAIAGVNSVQASAGILQLSQAFASGRLQGDEFRSISENIPPLLDIFAKELGVTRGELKKLGSEGKITSEVIATSLLKETENINEQFGQLSPTIGQAGTVLQNSFLNLTGQILDSSGALDSLASALISVSNAIDAIAGNQDKIDKFVFAVQLLISSLKGTTLVDFINRLEETSNGLENGANAFDNFRQAEDESLKSLEEYNEELAKLNSGFEEFKKNAEDTVTLTNVFKIEPSDAEDDIFTQLQKLREKTGVGLVNQIKAQKRQELDILEDAEKLGLLSEEEYLKQREKLNLLYAEKIRKAKENEISQKVLLERQGQDQIIDAVDDSLSKLSKINKDAFRAYQAFQIAMATVNTFRAVSNALATYPFPLNIAVGGAELARGLATVAQIRSIAPPRQTGGRVFEGQPYTVGENGRETFVPEQNGTILPNGAGMGATNVYITVNANDTQGFDDLLVKRRSVIVNVINDALNSQGKEALV